MGFRQKTLRKYDEAKLYEYAVGALARRMRTVAEIKRLMRTRVARQENAETLVEQVVSRLKEQRYLNDSEYAAQYSAYRRDNEKFGRMRVVQDLKARGVHPDVIARTVPTVYADISEEQQARDFLAKKRIKQPQDQKQAARVFRMLVRAGFATRSIVAILRRWNVEDETLTALEQERLEAEDNAGAEE